MPRGGKRPGAGRPKGSKEPHTLQKQAIRQRMTVRYQADADRIYDAQLAAALGTSYAVARDPKSGKFLPLSEQQTALMIASGQADKIEIWERPPSTQAATFLADRSIDRPSEHLQVTGEDGGPIEIVSKLASARKRLKERT